MEMTDIFVDVASGSNAVDRPESQRMLQPARDKKIAYVVTKLVSRLGRSTEDLQRDDGHDRDIKRKLSQNRKETDNIVTAIAAGAYHERLNARLNELRKEETQLIAQQSVKKYDKQQIKGVLKTYRNFPLFDAQTKKRAIQAIIKEVIINPDGTGAVDFSLPMVAGEGLEPTTSGL